MKMFRYFRKFSADQSGAVTVDWVVLTAAVVGLVAIAMNGLRGNMSSIGQRAGDHLGSATINTTFN
jgi:Flp pilus assembly pilin Flp